MARLAVNRVVAVQDQAGGPSAAWRSQTAKAIVNLAAVGAVRIGQAAGDAVPRVDRHRAGGTAVDVVRRPR